MRVAILAALDEGAEGAGAAAGAEEGGGVAPGAEGGARAGVAAREGRADVGGEGVAHARAVDTGVDERAELAHVLGGEPRRRAAQHEHARVLQLGRALAQQVVRDAHLHRDRQRAQPARAHGPHRLLHTPLPRLHHRRRLSQ